MIFDRSYVNNDFKLPLLFGSEVEFSIEGSNLLMKLGKPSQMSVEIHVRTW